MSIAVDISSAVYSQPAVILTAFPGVITRITPYKTLTPVATETFGAFQLPRNVKILGGKMHSTTTLGTTVTTELRVSDGTTTKNLIAAGAMGGGSKTVSQDAGATAVNFVTDNDDYCVIAEFDAVTSGAEGLLAVEISYTPFLEPNESRNASESA